MSDELKFKYGISTELFVAPKPGGKSLVVGGVGEDKARWMRVLSSRAAQLLWFNLVQLLDPENSAVAKSAGMTAEMRDVALPSVTTHMEVEQVDGEDLYQIVGWVENHPMWRAQLSVSDAQRFLMALDGALRPDGGPRNH
jgi:RNA polymerase subunit RPABC4/transcription elongation factor Spt4